jgi:hypothetical protein
LSLAELNSDALSLEFPILVLDIFQQSGYYSNLLLCLNIFYVNLTPLPSLMRDGKIKPVTDLTTLPEAILSPGLTLVGLSRVTGDIPCPILPYYVTFQCSVLWKRVN